MTLGPQIVSSSYGGLLKFLPAGETGVSSSQVQISDGKGKVTPLYISTSSIFVDAPFSASSDIIFDGLTNQDYANLICVNTVTGKLFYFATSSIKNVISASYATSASFAPNDNDWTIGASFMTASGNANIYVPGKEQQALGSAVGAFSHAEGGLTIANGDYSHAEGRNTSSSGNWSHAEGNETKSSSSYAHSEGSNTLALGIASHAEGFNTTSSGDYSHAEGLHTKATGEATHTEGTYTTAIGNNSHAEGFNTVSKGLWSHAEGSQTLASGSYSHTEGLFTTASKSYAKASGIGSQVVAMGDGAQAAGYGVVAYNEGQSVFGTYNKTIGLHPDDIFIVGTGLNSSAQQDALKVRMGTGQTILPQVLVSADPTDPTLPGLYFGEPSTVGSIRLVSSNGGNLLIQKYSGATWTTLQNIM